MMRKIFMAKVMSFIVDPSSLKNIVDQIIDLSVSAGNRIMEIYNSDFSVEDKQDKSPLTAADMASHQTIVEGLAGLTGEIPILSEESSKIDWAERKNWQTYWLVDPLDGTKEFIKKNGEFTVNIALIHDQRPVLGVVYVPATETVYFATEGLGAFKKENNNQTAISTRKTIVNQFAVAGSRSHGSDAQQTFMRRLGEAETMAIGSSLKFCLVAAGKVDIYPRFGLTSEWDTAAAQCVVEQAGGTVTTLDFQPLLYNTKESLLNPHFLVIGDTDFDWRPYLAGLTE